MKKQIQPISCKTMIVLLLSGLFLFTCLTSFATAAGTADGSSLPEHDNQKLFSTYLKQVLPGLGSGVKTKDSPAAGREGLVNKSLTGSVAMYDAVVPMIQEAASGKRTSTEFVVSGAQLNTADHWWSLEDLGIPGSTDADSIKAQLKDKEGILGFQILFALMNDYPYELYWFDKTNAIYDVDITIQDRDNAGTKQVSIASATLCMAVAGAYAASEYVLNAIPARVNTAVTNINQVISDNAALDDHAKLKAYANKICELVEYDQAAADNPSTPYGDPWQLVSIFDGDPNTKVVCEGYAKGFKYLCDLSKFSASVGCVTVTGTLTWESGSGLHMWNTIRMPDGAYYLADLTNSDIGNGCDYGFFLKGCVGKTGGPYACNGIRYEFDYDTKLSYGENSPWVTLSNSDYGQSFSGGDDSGEVNAAWVALQTQIDQAADGSTITLSDNLKASDGNVGLVFPEGKTLVLDLAGYTLDRGLTKETVDGYVMKIKGNLTITDNSSGGKITGGWNALYGGGVFVDGGNLTLKAGIICGNEAYYGGGINMSSGNLEIAGGIIQSNKAAVHGGGIYCDGGSLTMTNGTITGNSADKLGGGVGIEDKASFTMSGGEITDNEVLSIVGGCARGGGVGANNSDGFIMTGGTISGNRANAGGGNESIFHPTPDSFYMTSGGGVYAESFIMKGGTISKNISSYGGGIFVKKSFSMSGGVIQNNRGVVGGGIFMEDACQQYSRISAFLNGGSITNNTAENYAGGIYLCGTNVEDAYLEIGGVSITQNSGSTAGGIFAYWSSVKILNGKISNNSVSGEGGALCLHHSNLEMINGTISDNIAENGGGIYAYDESVFSLSGGIISGNLAKDSNGYSGTGGGVYICDSTFTISGGEISSNTASRSEGGISVSRSLFTMTGGKISNNTSLMWAPGGIFVESTCSYSITGGIIENNKPGDIWIPGDPVYGDYIWDTPSDTDNSPDSNNPTLPEDPAGSNDPSLPENPPGSNDPTPTEEPPGSNDPAPTENPPSSADPTPEPPDYKTDIGYALIDKIKDQEYTGKEIKPKPKVNIYGNPLSLNKDYTVAFTNNKNIGKATITITGIGNYTGTKKATFNIVPKAVKLSSVKAGKNKLTVKWKAGKDIDGYEIEYGDDKNFIHVKKITIKKAKTTSTEIKKLKAKKTYYVRIRAFKKVKGKKYYSEWSKAKSQKVK